MKVAQLFENSPSLDQLFNNQNAQCYLFSIFVMKMAKKYEPSWLSSSLSSTLSLSLRSLTALSSWSSWWSLSDKEKAKWELLYNRMIAAKKRYEDAGGKVKNDEYVR